MFSTIKNALRDTHPYQPQLLVLSSLLLMAVNLIIMTLPVLVYEPALRCQSVHQDQEAFSCGTEKACSDDYTYEIDYENSIPSLTTEFELVCKRHYLADLIGSFAFIGKLFGFLHTCLVDLNQPLARRLWRASLFLSIVSIAGAFSTNIESIWLIMFVSQYLGSMVNTYAFSHTVEVMKNNQFLSKICVEIIYFGWGMATIYGASLEMMNSDWRVILVVYTGLPIILLLIISLFSKKYHDDFKTIQQASDSRFHTIVSNPLSVSTPVHSLEGPLLPKNIVNKDQPRAKSQFAPQPKKPSNIDLIKDPTLRKLTLIMSGLEIVVGIIYYGAHLAINHLVGSVYINLMLIGAPEIIATLASAALSAKFARKPALYTLFLITFLVYTLFMFVETKQSSQGGEQSDDSLWYTQLFSSILLVTGKWLNTTAYTFFHAFMAELVPVGYTTSVYGVVSLTGSVFLVVIPQVITLVQSLGLSVYVVFGAANIIAIFLVYPLRETKESPKIDLEENGIEMQDLQQRSF